MSVYALRLAQCTALAPTSIKGLFQDKQPVSHSEHCHLQGQAASSSVDPESLERQNDQNIGNLGDRVSLLRQVRGSYLDAQEHGQ